MYCVFGLAHIYSQDDTVIHVELLVLLFELNFPSLNLGSWLLAPAYASNERLDQVSRFPQILAGSGHVVPVALASDLSHLRSQCR